MHLCRERIETNKLDKHSLTDIAPWEYQHELITWVLHYRVDFANL
jgi:hypothetical protein